MNKKNYDPSANGIKQRKERKTKEDCMKKKGEKSHKDLNVSYHAIDEPFLSLCKCVSTAKIFFPTSSRSRQIYFSTLQQLSRCSKKNPSKNRIKERKRKETDVSLPHWAKISSSSGLPDSS